MNSRKWSSGGRRGAATSYAASRELNSLLQQRSRCSGLRRRRIPHRRPLWCSPRVIPRMFTTFPLSQCGVMSSPDHEALALYL